MTASSGYTHFTYHLRHWLSMEIRRGHSLRACAVLMGYHHSTLSREISRNGIRQGRKIFYDPRVAHFRAITRWRQSKQYKLLKYPHLYRFVEVMLQRSWAPHEIAGFLQRKKWKQTISHEAIYKFIYEYEREWIELLPRGKRTRTQRKNKNKNRQKTLIPNRKLIDLRAKHIDKRNTIGHFEVDCMVTKKTKEAVLVIVERKTRFMMIHKLERKTAECVRDGIIKLLWPYRKEVKTITYDNGLENVLHQEINEKLKCKSFFCNPYHSWEKGSVEHAIGMLRKYIPKKTNLEMVSKKDLKYYEYLINNKPRKIHNFVSAKDMFNVRRCS
jgi:IS30 family transposase